MADLRVSFDGVWPIQEPSDNVAKFRGDRPTELGDLVAKQKKTSAVKQVHPELPFRVS